MIELFYTMYSLHSVVMDLFYVMYSSHSVMIDFICNVFFALCLLLMICFM